MAPSAWQAKHCSPILYKPPHAAVVKKRGVVGDVLDCPSGIRHVVDAGQPGSCTERENLDGDVINLASPFVDPTMRGPQRQLTGKRDDDSGIFARY